MATRLSPTIRVPINFGNPADIADAVQTEIGSTTVYVPENSVSLPITFLSVILYISHQDISTATGATITECRAIVDIDGNLSTVTETGDLTHSSENRSGIWGPLDYTAFFNTRYGTGTSKLVTVDCYFDISTGTGLDTRGVYAWFEIQYQYDDQSTINRQHCVSFDFESPTGSLTQTANTAFGTIPQLTGSGGWLNGYSSLNITHIWAQVRGNISLANTAGDCNINYSFDGSGSNSLPTRVTTLISNTWQVYLIDLSSLDFSTSHTLDLWLAQALDRFNHLNVSIFITFNYSLTGTTRILNYLELPFDFATPLNGTTSAEAHRQLRQIYIPEPGTITTRNISLNIMYGSNANSTVQVKSGSQASFTGYAMVATITCGQFEFTHLSDARSSAGSAITLVRGRNDLTIDLYRSVGAVSNVSGILKLLYESDVPDSPDGGTSHGIDIQSKIVFQFARQMPHSSSTDVTVSDLAIPIPETNFFNSSAGIKINCWILTAISTINAALEILSGELDGDGWEFIYTDPLIIDGELSFMEIFARAKGCFNRYPNDPFGGMDITTPRKIRTAFTAATRFGYKLFCNYHGQYFNLSGDITGSNGGTVDIYVFNSYDNSLEFQTSRVGNGSFSVNVYNPVQNYYVVARENNDLKGTSKLDVAGSGFDINLYGSGLREYGFGSA